jgi:hypothetical protein
MMKFDSLPLVQQIVTLGYLRQLLALSPLAENPFAPLLYKDRRSPLQSFKSLWNLGLCDSLLFRHEGLSRKNPVIALIGISTVQLLSTNPFAGMCTWITAGNGIAVRAGTKKPT